MTRAQFHNFIVAPSTGQLLDAMLADNAAVDAMQIARTAPLSRPCVLCPCTAWLESVDPDGAQRFQCNFGHVTIIAKRTV
jgi:hypothetical protein